MKLTQFQWLKLSFLINLIILVGILLGQTNLIESNEGMTFCVLVLSVGLTTKETSDIFLRESVRISFALLEKYLLKIFEIAIGLEMVVPSTDSLFGISVDIFFLIVKIDFEFFHVFFYVIPVGFKIMISVVCFAFLQNCR